ncbi:8-oxo-dGTP pyrophosphatase MutT (NUDIX family) [Crossiella equi]|uniref:8-oxo-dGTP pyrophosphatase MutT (NUDIX family) n=1 Tax=Crossiella equi TaxID=130796 RepID=A0ABS5A4Y0_9PSEU|nr:NUDIX domain-containing protein [Crossiella equi]MBP2471294.1 8-oxo-dGTP pyrophosphatase MutT (NUDIX family) [Crossiella equi]
MTAIDKIALLHLVDRGLLAARSHGHDAFYLPGGKRDPGESDVDTLVRELAEELGVTVDPATARPAGTWQAQAHGKPDGVVVRLTCYTADYTGTPVASSEIAELAWLTHADRDRASATAQLVLDDLHARGLLA